MWKSGKGQKSEVKKFEAKVPIYATLFGTPMDDIFGHETVLIEKSWTPKDDLCE